MIPASPKARKLIKTLAAGLLVAATASAGMYAVAATAATFIAASFTKAETTRHTRILELASAETRIVAEHREARAQCELLAAKKKKHLCIAEASAERKRAIRSARQLAGSDPTSIQW